MSLLVEFDRAKARCEITFEDVDTRRWQVVPANFSSIRAELRPNL